MLEKLRRLMARKDIANISHAGVTGMRLRCILGGLEIGGIAGINCTIKFWLWISMAGKDVGNAKQDNAGKDRECYGL